METPGTRILVIEDDRDIRSLIAERLRAAGYDALTAADGAEAPGGDLERPPLVERGPTEVRTAARAFNVMQNRLREMLSAYSTPGAHRLSERLSVKTRATLNHVTGRAPTGAAQL